MYVLLGKENCSPCREAKQTLRKLGVDYTYVDIEATEGMIGFLTGVLGVRTVPQLLKTSNLNEVVNDVT